MTMKDRPEWVSRPDVCSYSDVNGFRERLNKPCCFKEANRKNEGPSH